MKKVIIFIFVFFSLIFISECEDNNPEDDFEESHFDYEDFDGSQYFKESLKEYLEENKLFDSEKIIKKEQMKKIFLDVITEGDPEGTPDYMEGIFQELAEYFVNLYYKERKEIKGKDLYDLIDIKEISMKFEAMMGNSVNFGGEEEFDYDSRDAVGNPNPDI